MKTWLPSAPVQIGARPILNALTVDVEDYFHVSAFADVVSRSQWETLESRVCSNTERILDIFADAEVRATFFVLGWVAERFPALVRRVWSAGHEVASHSYAHSLVYDCSPEEFRADLRRAKAVIEDACNAEVCGYRAPSYSITQRSLWALDVLAEEGYAFDSSIYPIRHDRYGIPTWPRHIHRLSHGSSSIWELPGSTIQVAGQNLPVGGGGYFRLLPYAWTSGGIRRLNEVERRPAIFYLHPWELDPDQPRIHGRVTSRIRHYSNLHRTERRLRRLLKEFRFGTVSEVLEQFHAHGTVPGIDQCIAGTSPNVDVSRTLL
jgi:polysaccharide deacetylase family protein (PEP-CTERM system associated)